jgi:hypothetical protein
MQYVGRLELASTFPLPAMNGAALGGYKPGPSPAGHIYPPKTYPLVPSHNHITHTIQYNYGTYLMVCPMVLGGGSVIECQTLGTSRCSRSGSGLALADRHAAGGGCGCVSMALRTEGRFSEGLACRAIGRLALPPFQLANVDPIIIMCREASGPPALRLDHAHMCYEPVAMGGRIPLRGHCLTASLRRATCHQVRVCTQVAACPTVRMAAWLRGQRRP